MTEKNAMALMQQYVDGWKQNNLEMILSCLKDDCVVIESHGPTYHGINDIEKWFKFWVQAKSEILKWEILSFIFCEKNKAAFCEWDFACISGGIQYDLTGASAVRFSGEKISFIHEYRMTQPAYQWKGDKLNSD